jgi:hypothetical protein
MPNQSTNKPPIQVLLAGCLFTLLLLPALWAFQIVRSLGYSVVRDPLQILVDGSAHQGGSRAFKAVPLGTDGTDKDSVADASPDKISFRILALSPRVKGREISIQAGGSTWRIGRDGRTSGGSPGHRFAEAIFLDDAGNTHSYQEGKIDPDLVVVNWQDPWGWLRSTFRFGLPIEAGVLGFGLALLPWLLWTRRKAVFAPPSSWISGSWKIPLGFTVMVLLGHFLAPRWIPTVLAYFSALAMWVGTAIRRLPAGRALPRLPRWHLVAVALLVVAGFATKARLSDWGQPLVLHTDEYAVVDPAGALSRDGGLDPKEFEHPNHPSIYLLTIVSQATSEIMFGQPLGRTFESHLALWHQVGRILSALWGALLAWAVWAGLRRFDPKAALLACALATLFPAIIQNSAFATPDVSQACLAALFAWLLSRRVADGDSRSLVLAALVAALAACEKFSGAVLFPFLVLGACSGKIRKDWVPSALRASIAYFLLLFLTCPYIFLKAHLVLISVIGESRSTHPGADGMGLWGNLGFYVDTWRQDASLLMSIAIVPGALRLLRRGAPALPLFTGLVFLASLAALPLHWARWELPFLPILLQCAAMGLTIPFSLAESRPRASRASWIAFGVVLSLLPLSHQLLRCVQASRLAKARDTRLDALEWSRFAGLDTANTLVGHYTGLAPVWKRGFDMESSYRDPIYMRNRRWAMVSTNHYQRYFADSAKFPGEVKFWRSFLELPEVARFAAKDPSITLHAQADWADLPLAAAYLRQDPAATRVGPLVRVFRLPDSCPDLPRQTAIL